MKFKNAEADFYLSTNKQDLKKYKSKKVVRDFFIGKKKMATPDFGQLFSGKPKKLAEIGQFFLIRFLKNLG